MELNSFIIYFVLYEINLLQNRNSLKNFFHFIKYFFYLHVYIYLLHKQNNKTTNL